VFVTIEDNAASGLQISHPIFRHHGSQCYTSIRVSEPKILAAVFGIAVRIHTAFLNPPVRDGVIPKVAHSSRVDATLLSLEFGDEFHGADFGSTTDSARGKDRSVCCQFSLLRFIYLKTCLKASKRVLSGLSTPDTSDVRC